MFEIPSDLRAYIKPLIEKGGKKKKDVIKKSTSVTFVSPFTTMFDVYYLFFLLGAVIGKERSYEEEKTTEMIESFPASFNNHRDLLLGFVIWIYCKNRNYSIEERSTLQELVRRILNEYDPRSLTNTSFKFMNASAYAGYHFFLEQHGRIDNPVIFLIEIIDLIKKKLEERT